MTSHIQNLPEPGDLAYQIFSSDPRVHDFARKKFFIGEGGRNTDEQNRKALIQGVLKIWEDAAKRPTDLTKEINKIYIEAKKLGERVARRWDVDISPTLVASLARNENLWPMPFPRTVIRPGETQPICSQPDITLRGRRLVLGPKHVCDLLLVESIRIANIDLVVSPAGVYGGCFSDVAFPFWLDLPTMGPANTARLHVRNVGNEGISIAPVIFGVIPKDFMFGQNRP